MAVQEIIQDLIIQPGQSQDKRMPAELGIHFADIDERTDEELLRFTQKFAEFVRLYLHDPSLPEDPSDPNPNWSKFFPADLAGIRRLLNDKSGEVTPHLALYLSFLKLYLAGPQETVNQFTGRHLDFYFSEILRLSKKGAVPDKAHVVLELKKNSTPVVLGPDDPFSAGKDDTKVELIYKPTGETVINTSKVESLCSIFYDQTGHGTIRYAPVASSSDGMGGKLTGEEAKWQAFGSNALPPVEIGFAIASPVLRMKEGHRKVTLNLTLSNVNHAVIHDESLKGAFELFVTGEKSWLGPFATAPTLSSGNVLSFLVTIPASEKAVADYDVSIHGYRYTCKSPVIQVLLKTDKPAVSLGYDDFAGIKVIKGAIDVDVSGITSLSLEGDQGTFNPKKPFAPFGQQPTIGSTFLVGYTEALDKKISELIVSVNWKNPPQNFGTYYSAYGVSVSNAGFTADVSFTSRENRQYARSGVPLFENTDARLPHDFVFTPGHIPLTVAYPAGRKVFSLRQTETAWSRKFLREMLVFSPVLINKPALHENARGMVSFILNNGFFHAEYPKKTVENILGYAKQTGDSPAFASLNEPYTPVIQNISLSYKATSDEINISSNSLDDFTNDEIQFFQVAYFGQIQEHSYQRYQFGYLVDKLVSLFPEYKNEGELLIGFSGLNPGDSVSVLFQVAEGSENPDLPQENIDWSVLSDNYWKPLSYAEVVLDTTNRLLKSGIIRFVIPHDATTANTLMPAGKIWIRAAIRRNVEAVCRMVDIAANAIEVQFADQGNDPKHLASPMEKNRIDKLKNGNASVKSLSQPFASFGGSRAESDNSFFTRSSERLRHKNRCISPWDYERIVLQEFPEVHKVKCIPHAKFMPGLNKYCWLAPGNVVLVVVPDTTNQNAVDPLSPKLNGNTISRITQLLKRQSGMQVNVTVKNPAYQKLQLDFRVKFHAGYEFNFYSEKLKGQIRQYLSPWAYQEGRDITFGGKIYKSVLLHFVEEVDYVDFVEDFYLYSFSELSGKSNDLNEVIPESPDTILVSAATHIIHEIY
ncbi:MAG: baseplate J/gp47 family protein [Prolixibacteraceae bacterium]